MASPDDGDVRRVRADDLRYLLAVANTGRLNVAADALGVDHTTVSRRLQALERALGVRLVERGVHGWELTAIGQGVVERARAIDDLVTEVVIAARGQAPGALSGSLRMTAPDGFGATFVVPAVAKVREQHPDLDIELITATRQLTLVQSGFDLAVAVGQPATKRLFVELLTDYSLSLYASSGYLARFGAPATVEELARRTLVFYVDSLLEVDDLNLGRFLFGVRARFSSTNIFAQVEATLAGAGIGILPRFLAIRHPELIEVELPGVPTKVSLALATRPGGISRPAIGVVRHALQREVRERRDELLAPQHRP